MLCIAALGVNVLYCREHELEVVDGSASKQLLQFLDGHADVGADARSVPFATSLPLCTGTVVPRPSGWRMMWWLPVTRATLNPARSKARTIRSPCTDGTAGIRRHQP
jgi:hypothetical protein